MEQPHLPPIALRNGRVQTAVNLTTPDRVPFVPMLGNFYAMGYGVPIEDAMKNPGLIREPMEKLLRQYDPDLLYAPMFFPISVMERARSTNMRWPGETHHLPPNTPYQFIDRSYIETEDDYRAFIQDPTRYMLTRVLPVRYAALGGLAALDVTALCGPSPLSLAGAGIPPVAEALGTLVESGQLALQCIGAHTELAIHAVELGFPIFGATVPLCPFDEFADCYRGLIATVTDLAEDPELVAEAVSRLADVTIPAAVAQAKMTHSAYSMIPLHCGVDEFMSPHNYSTYYWPTLKRLIMALIEADVTPIVVTEGNYNSRLEQLLDVPAGKVIYSFEKVDMKRAKEVLGGTACIMGNLPTAALISGTPERVRDLTHKLIDDCAPGGGYIMSNSISLDNAEHELLEAWHQATLDFGQY